MNAFGEYMESVLRGERPSADLAAGYAERYNWFTAARVLGAYLSDSVCDEFGDIVMAGRSVSSLKLHHIDKNRLADAAPQETSTDEIIEKFLLGGNYRIVAEDGSDALAEEIRTEPELSDEDDLVSEELAEIYLSQGLLNEALAIYRKLSLLNTEKSIYFAEIIDKIENNN
ncbi:MAG: hypothetical protein J1E33_02770 [Alistipes sp.]|nr:hypothetical protein [Alistipes sp.]